MLVDKLLKSKIITDEIIDCLVGKKQRDIKKVFDNIATFYVPINFVMHRK